MSTTSGGPAHRYVTFAAAGVLAATGLLSGPASASPRQQPVRSDLGAQECARDVNAHGVVVTDTHLVVRGRVTALPGGLDAGVALNDRGWVAGTVRGVPAVWDGRRTTVIGLLHPSDTFAFVTGMNERGDVVGGSGSTATGTRAFLWHSGRLVELRSPGTTALASGINDRGQVVGGYTDADQQQNAVRWLPGGTMVELPALGGPGASSLATDVNNSGVAVGYSAEGTSGGLRAVRWAPSGSVSTVDPAGTTLGIASDIDDRGDIVGETSSATTAQTAFLRTASGQLTLMPPEPPQSGSTALAVSERRVVVGCEFSADATVSTRWSPR